MTIDEIIEQYPVSRDEIKAVLDHFAPEQVYFVGDSDMCTNFQFSDAAIKLHKLINN